MNIVQVVEVDIAKVGELNLLVCVVVFLASLATLWRLTQCRKTAYDFVFRATVCWTLAWAVWIGLWALIWLQGVPQGNWHSLSLGLSDANTVLQLLFCVGLIQGSRFKGKEYAVFAVLMLAFVVTADFFIHFFPSKSLQGNSVAGILQERWSLAIGMFASLVLGWGFKVRYGTLKVLIIGFVYAIMQPPAYEALFGELKGTDSALVILALLAALKVVFAWSVIYYLGIQPRDGKNLIHIEEEKPNAEKHDQWWPWFPKVFVGIGLFVVGIEVWRLSSGGLKTPIIGKIIGLIISAAVFLGAIDYLILKFIGRKKKLNSGSDRAI
jgi:hypothetical protein